MATLQTLVSFDHDDNPDDGRSPSNSVVADAQGNLFGTTSAGGTYDQGTVFELPNVFGTYGSDPTTLISFYGGDGSIPNSNLILDLDGNVFGTTAFGPGYGTVYELINHTDFYDNTPKTLVAFNNANGSTPTGSLIMDGDGNLFGVTASGGAHGAGTVFEIPVVNGSYASAPITLVNFDNSDGGFPVGGLITDKNGDLFGVTSGGGPSNYGTVFEIKNDFGTYDSTPTTLVNFDNTNGANPEAGLVMDDSGNLFGTTEAGGSSDEGTVFEISFDTDHYADSPTTLVTFTGDNGANPYDSLVIDAKGDLFGTTSAGGDSDNGTVFEISNDNGNYADKPTTLISFSGDNGAKPYASLFPDAQGDLFGTTNRGGENSEGTVFELTDTGFQTACYCRGTLITTSRGEVAVEDLAIGDTVLTISGALRPIKWIGQRSYSGRFLAGKADILPVCFKAGSLDDNTPTRDLWVSPHHAMYLDGLLIEAKDLINGASIFRGTRIDNVEYFHIELDSHDVIFAEGAYSETYFDDDNRGMFHNAHSFKSSDPAAITAGARYYAPRVEDGFHVEEVRNRLQARADRLFIAYKEGAR